MTTDTLDVATNQQDAIAALGIDEALWNELRRQEGFPPRTSQGWDLGAIRQWLRDADDEAPPKADPPPPSERAPTTEPDPPPQAPEIRTLTITIPVCAPDPGSYIAAMAGRFNTRLDRGDQLEGFKHLHAGLRASNAELRSGRPVDGAPDVLRWLFEQVQQQLGG